MFDFTPVGARHRARRRRLPDLRLPAAARATGADAATLRRGVRDQGLHHRGARRRRSRRWSARPSRDLETLAEGEVTVIGIIRERHPPLLAAGRLRRCAPATSCCSRASPRRWSRSSRGRQARARPAKDGEIASRPATDEIGVIEAVVGARTRPDRQLRRRRLGLRERYGSTCWRSAAADASVTERLRRIAASGRRRDRAAGRPGRLPDTLARARAACRWPSATSASAAAARPGSADRDPGRRHGAGGAPAGAGAGRLLRRGGAAAADPASLPLREAYEAIEWPILIMLAALIPVSEALRTTGGTDLIAGWLVAAAGGAAADRRAGADPGRSPWR